MQNPDANLLDLAGRLSDGDAIDWENEVGNATDDQRTQWGIGAADVAAQPAAAHPARHRPQAHGAGRQVAFRRAGG